MIDQYRSPTTVVISRDQSNFFVSTVVSGNGPSGVTSGSTINIAGYSNITAFVQRGVSTGAVELQVSPDGINWWQWKNYTTGALPTAGEATTLDQAVGVSGSAGFSANYIRGVYNVSGTASAGQGIAVVVNGTVL